MKVTILQTDIEWGRPEVNIDRAEALMTQEPGGRPLCIARNVGYGLCNGTLRHR